MTPPQCSFVEVRGRRLEVERIVGDPARPTLVFLHEGLGSVSLWKDFPASVAEATGCPAVVYSRYGYGNSDLLQAPFAVDYMHREALETLPELLAALGVAEPVLVGHSDGASIALIHAGRAGARSRGPACGDATAEVRVAPADLSGAPSPAPGSHLRPPGVGTAPPSAGAGNRLRGLALLAPHVFVEDISVQSIAEARVAFETTDLPEKLARHHADPRRTFYGWNDIWLHPDFRAWNIEGFLPSIGCPVLAIQGHDDEYGTMAQIEAIAARVGGSCELVKLEACGHSPHRDQPERTLAAIARFVAQVAAA